MLHTLSMEYNLVTPLKVSKFQNFTKWNCLKFSRDCETDCVETILHSCSLFCLCEVCFSVKWHSLKKEDIEISLRLFLKS